MIDVKLHDIGEGMTEGEVIHYLVKVGDKVQTDQPLVEVQTDKMVAELTSPCTGIVKEIQIAVGETVKVGTSLLSLESAGGDHSQKSQPVKDLIKENGSSNPSKIEENLVEFTYKRVLATPHTRKIAREHNINLEDIIPSDPSGRITEEDVISFLDNTNKKIEPKQLIAEKLNAPSHSEEIPYRGIRKKIAENMKKSLFTIPHVTHFDEVNMTNLLEMKEQLKAAGNSISVPAFLLKALVISLKDFPIFNAELDEENSRILLKKTYHIGLATNTENGLIVPVLHDADKKSLKQINHEIKDLTQKALAGSLHLSAMQNSTITISNVGPLGSIAATPIINFPETALIAFHKTKKRPIVNENDEIVIGHIMSLSMSFDHRVADGATAIAFSNRFSSLIENPHKLILEMI